MNTLTSINAYSFAHTTFSEHLMSRTTLELPQRNDTFFLFLRDFFLCGITKYRQNFENHIPNTNIAYFFLKSLILQF